MAKFVNLSVTAVSPAYVPAVSLTVRTGLVNEAEHVGLPDAGAVTVQTLAGSTAIPAPDSVMAIPALGPGVMPCVGVNEIVTAVVVAIAAAAPSAMERSLIPLIVGNVPILVESKSTKGNAPKLDEVLAATFESAG